ncbi:MAG: amino acid permease-associated region [Actinomycetia bacterium]|jgi:GABA permease|nr:amino acid permease-associated region [Actinomycetes bacterium]
MRRYLVVANQTLGGGHLLAVLRELAGEPSTFHVLVPASPPVDHLWTESEAMLIARTRLEAALERFRSVGIEATGEVGDGRPLQAIDDVLARDTFDAIVLSTLPPRLSKWLRLDLVHRVQTSFGLPVHHVISHRETVDL